MKIHEYQAKSLLKKAGVAVPEGIVCKTADEVAATRAAGYRPYDRYAGDEVLREVIDLLDSGFFASGDRELFQPLVKCLLEHDEYLRPVRMPLAQALKMVDEGDITDAKTIISLLMLERHLARQG